MNKKEIFTFRGVNQDITKSKHSKEFYYEGNNIRISSTDSQSTGAISNEKGNKFAFSIPTPTVEFNKSYISYGDKKLNFAGQPKELEKFGTMVSGEQIIIGHTNTRDSVIIFSTDSAGFDCIWEVKELDGDKFDVTLLYLRDLGFSIHNPIQAVYNYENERIQKVYWADGKNQLRFINTKHSKKNEHNENLIDVASNTINIVGNFDISQPKVIDVVSGGTHTAGKVQYTYNLYRLNSSQTKLAPLSELVPLGKGDGQGGGDVNEIVGATPVVKINNLDKEYTHIKVYAVKYTSYNQIPSISLIKDQEISSSREINIFDDGNVINDISMAEFLFLGSDPITPKHIESKDNILFSANIKENNFDVDIDARAFSFKGGLSPVAKVYDNVRLEYREITNTVPSIINVNSSVIKDEEGNLTLNDGFTEPTEETTYTTTTEVKPVVMGDATIIKPTNFDVPEKKDTVNVDYDTYKFQANGSTLGGEGKYIKYEIIRATDVIDPESKQFFKDNEVYRLGVQFYNRLGQKSLPKWMADFRAPEGNLVGKYNTLRVTLKPEFYVWLNTSSNFKSEDEKPVGYRVLRANRTQNDKTIITQGIINGMMSNYRGKGKSHPGSSEVRSRTNAGNKMPSLQRAFGNIDYGQIRGAKHYRKLDPGGDPASKREVHSAKSSDHQVAETFQYNILMQLFSPEVMFGSVSLYEGLKLRVKGANKKSKDNFWGQERLISTKEIITEGKALGAATPHYRPTGSTESTTIGSVNHLCDKGIFGPAHADSNAEMDFIQIYRGFDGDFVQGNGKKYPVYGKPILTEKGQGLTTYNNDGEFKFYNSLQPMMVDGGDSRSETSLPLSSVNSWGAQCITYVLGSNEIDSESRPRYEKLWSESGIADNDVALVAELVKNDLQVYLGGIYGGNSYEDKKRTSYIEIGKYTPIDIDNIVINSPGDTFVQNFTFSKIVKTDTEVYASTSEQITEIVSTRVESTIDLRNRNDFSLNSWDARFQPRYDEFHSYNRVYSQQSTLMQSQDLDYNFREVKDFDTRIMASKVKVPGENIDNWTDMLVNETQDLNGKHGPINSLVSFKDNVYALQDNAVAAIGINPRVQVQGSDGIAVELGAGGVLHDYKYITTNSGTLNKWGVTATENGLYYLDTKNKTFNRLANGIEKLSDLHGLHSWFQNNLDYDSVKLDNPYLGTGVSTAYDIVNNSVLLSLHQGSPYTRLFSEASNSFVGLMDYCPSLYICRDSRLYSLAPNNNSIYEHFKGEYNNFYGTYYPSYVTLLINPASNHHSIFNNIEFNSELYLDGKDQFDKTLTHITAWNEYQESEKTPLTVGRGSNLKRLFRTWRANIPRMGRERMRNPWLYLKLELDNENNYKLILHDVIVNYTVS